tara:strand:+ start:434 stop:802 length:369 start_codon:yes stop_codon:yes gene_type:complete
VPEEREQQLLMYQTVRMVKILFSVQSLQRVEVVLAGEAWRRHTPDRVEMVVQVVEDAIMVLVVQVTPLQQPHPKEMMVVGLPLEEPEAAVAVEVILLLELLGILVLVVLVEQELQVLLLVLL